MATAERHISSSLTSLLICCVPLFAVLVQKYAEPKSASRDVVTWPRRGAIGWPSWWAGPARGSITWIALMMVVCLGYCFGPMILATKLAHVPASLSSRRDRVRRNLLDPWSVAHWPTHVSGETWSCMAVLSVVCTAAAFLVFFELVKEVVRRDRWSSPTSIPLSPSCSASSGSTRRSPRALSSAFPRPGGVHLRHQSIEGAASSELLGVLSGDSDVIVDHQPE